MTTSVKRKKVTETMEQKLQALFRIDAGESLTKIAQELGVASKLDSVAKGYKVKKERVTLLPCSNASGDLKFPLLVIGKSVKPRAFKNVNMSALPAQYTSQKSAWMNGNIFKNWFFETFVPTTKTFLKQKKLPKKAVLFIDNAPCHPSESELRDGEIYVKFLPPNVTSLIQPMDQAAEAWEGVKPETLQKSWKKLWPNIPQENYRRDETTSNEDTDFIQVFQELKGCAEVEANDISEWINGDTDVGHQVLSDDEIVNACIENIEIEVDSSEDEDDGTDQSTGPTHGEATAMLEQLMTSRNKVKHLLLSY
ncbi:jerky protein homolog-like [Sipha flava]|uniref:Jerky protein homolog-like n=1 Tax=Sipha flava TaxID=143950 RepID=A0A8B8GQ50_9HEMI|nr:jerky protein homolog-like [Sipha flava]